MSKASKYKKPSNKIKRKLVEAKTASEDLSKSYQGRLREQESIEVDMQRLRSDFAGRQAYVNHLRIRALDWKHKCLSAIRDRDVVRAHLV